MQLTTRLVWLLALTPLLLAMITMAESSWSSAEDILRNLGKLTGIGGLGFMLISAALSSRVPGFDAIFGGLTKLWLTHHRLAAVSFLLLLAHPLLLAFAEGRDIAAARGLLFPDRDVVPVYAGWAALLLMIIFLAPGFRFFGEPDYQRWKTVHKLAGPAVAFSIAHALLLNRTIPEPWAILLWGSFALLAVAAFAYRWLFSRAYLPGPAGRLPYRVSRVTPVMSGIVELSLSPEKRSLAYEAGQFVYLSPHDPFLAAGIGEEHPYTVSSSPTEAELRIAIKDLGNASHAIQQIQPGSEVSIEGPYGALFNSGAPNSPELWIAGGIGITPFLSRARSLGESREPVDISLVLCVQDEARALFREELEQIERSLPGFRFRMHYFYREGPLRREFIEHHFGDLSHRTLFVCGPTPLMKIAGKIASEAGIPTARFHSEEFSLL